MGNKVKVSPINFKLNKFEFKKDDDNKYFEFKGVAYSGGIIENHGFFEKLIIDTAQVKTLKDQTPIYFQHNPNNIVGFSTVTVGEGRIDIEGKISNSGKGKDIKNLSDMGFDWELSVGIAPNLIEEAVEDMSINGTSIEKGTAIFRDNSLIEVSIVDIGADRNTSTQFSNIYKEKLVKFNNIGGTMKKTQLTKITDDNKDQFEFACGACTGTIDSISSELESLRAEKEALEAERDELKATIEKGVLEAKVSRIKEAFLSKDIEVSDEVIATFAKSEMEVDSIVASFSVKKKEDTPVKKDLSYLQKETTVEVTAPTPKIDFSALSQDEFFAEVNAFASKEKITYEEALDKLINN